MMDRHLAQLIRAVPLTKRAGGLSSLWPGNWWPAKPGLQPDATPKPLPNGQTAGSFVPAGPPVAEYESPPPTSTTDTVKDLGTGWPNQVTTTQVPQRIERSTVRSTKVPMGPKEHAEYLKRRQENADLDKLNLQIQDLTHQHATRRQALSGQPAIPGAPGFESGPAPYQANINKLQQSEQDLARAQSALTRSNQAYGNLRNATPKPAPKPTGGNQAATNNLMLQGHTRQGAGMMQQLQGATRGVAPAPSSAPASAPKSSPQPAGVPNLVPRGAPGPRKLWTVS
jgi:hypothetical protein